MADGVRHFPVPYSVDESGAGCLTKQSAYSVVRVLAWWIAAGRDEHGPGVVGEREESNFGERGEGALHFGRSRVDSAQIARR